MADSAARTLRISTKTIGILHFQCQAPLGPDTFVPNKHSQDSAQAIQCNRERYGSKSVSPVYFVFFHWNCVSEFFAYEFNWKTWKRGFMEIIERFHLHTRGNCLLQGTTDPPVVAIEWTFTFWCVSCCSTCPSQQYGGWQGQMCSSLRKHLQIDETQAN